MGSASSSQQTFAPVAQPLACDIEPSPEQPFVATGETCVTEGGILNVGSAHNLLQPKESHANRSCCAPLVDEEDASSVKKIDTETTKPEDPVRELVAFASLSIQNSSEFNSGSRRTTVSTPSDRGANNASASSPRVSFTCALRFDDTLASSQNPNPQSLSELEISFSSTAVSTEAGEASLGSPMDCHTVSLPLTPIWAKHRHQKAVPRRARRFPPLPDVE